jgi:hypothetical protein
LDNLVRPGVQVLVTSLSPTAWDERVDELIDGCCLATARAIAEVVKGDDKGF